MVDQKDIEAAHKRVDEAVRAVRAEIAAKDARIKELEGKLATTAELLAGDNEHMSKQQDTINAQAAEIADLRFELKVRDFMDRGHVRYNAEMLAREQMERETEDV